LEKLDKFLANRVRQITENEYLGHNFSYPASSAAVVFGGYLSAPLVASYFSNNRKKK
jgi:hypothetical protein